MSTAVVQRVAELARAEMRLADDDADANRINRKAAVAVEHITTYLDPPVPWVDDPEKWPAAIIDAAVTVTNELYRRKDAPFGLTEAWGDDGVRSRISSDPLAGVRHLLDPHKQRWGIA